MARGLSVKEVTIDTFTQTMSRTNVFSITSGKGGVGKTNVVANLAVALAMAGKRVLVMDADLGLANLDLFLGVNPENTLADFFAGTKPLADIITTGPLGIMILPGASGIPALTALSHQQKLQLLTELDALTHEIDLVLVDTGTGISDSVTYFAAAAQEVVVVVTPEPSSITDAYAMVKVLSSTRDEKRFWILANNTEDEAEAWRLYDTLSGAASRFLNVSLDLLGWIPRDQELLRAILQCKTVVTASSGSPSSLAFMRIARRLARVATEETRVKGNLQFFFRRILESAVGEQ